MTRSIWLAAAVLPLLQAQTVPPVTPPAPRGPVETLVTFDPGRTEMRFDLGKRQIWAGDVFLRDCGTDEAAAREALRLIRLLRLTQRGVIGAPQPIMEYWLAEGEPPLDMDLGLTLQTFDPAGLRAESLKGHWMLHD